jgi:superfamily II helicase
MPARLLVFTGKLTGRAFALPPQGKVILGRSKEASITIPDINLSRAHCSVAATPQGYMLEDLDSTNGTYMNGKRIRQVLLRENDRIVLGETELEFRARDRVDDAERKMRSTAVGAGEELSPADALRMLKGSGSRTMMVQQPGPAAAGKEGTAKRVRRVKFCDICDVNVPRTDIDSGVAREVAGRLLCAECVGRLQGMNIDAVASLDLALDQLRKAVRREKGL